MVISSSRSHIEVNHSILRLIVSDSFSSLMCVCVCVDVCVSKLNTAPACGVVRVPQCLLVLERLCVWVSGAEELCVWNEDFQLQCQSQNHSDAGEDTQHQQSAVTINPSQADVLRQLSSPPRLHTSRVMLPCFGILQELLL